MTWGVHPGGQWEFLTCPLFEVLLEGNRGGGKTDVLLMDFIKHIGVGYGPAWRGILFRQTYPNLEEVIAKSLRWFPAAVPGAKYNAGKHVWYFPAGETLHFRHAAKERDYANYHGHEYPWVAFEELTNWPNDKLYVDMMSVCRSSHPDMPRHFRATTNPYGVGHHWVKAHLHRPGPPRHALCGLQRRVSHRDPCGPVGEREPAGE